MYNGSLTTFVTSELQIDNVLENWETHGIIAIYHELSIENQVVITIEGTKKGEVKQSLKLVWVNLERKLWLPFVLQNFNKQIE